MPETVCIDTATGLIDKTCSSSATTLLNLNKPTNTSFPLNSATSQPATSFTVCGVTGASRRYQAVEQAGLTSVTSTNFLGDITGATTSTGVPPTPGAAGTTCPISSVGNPRSAIAAFYTDLQSFTTGNPLTAGVNGIESVSAVSSTSPANYKVNATSSTKANVLDLTSTNFANLYKGEDANSNNTLDTGEDLNNNGILDRGSILTINANGQNDPVFVLRAPNADVLIDGLSIKLNGVDPNKVFWTFPRIGAKALTIQATSAANPTVLVGNFIGNMPAANNTDSVDNNTGLNIGNTSGGRGVAIRSARFLGFRSVTTKQAATEGKGAFGVDGTAMITAMTTVNQPVVVPVLQVHAPNTKGVAQGGGRRYILPQAPSSTDRYIYGINGDPSATRSGNVGNGQWTQRVTSATTEVNVYFVAGNTPSRSYVPYTTSPRAGNANQTIYTGETGGGLHNFVRFSENWTGQNLKISGGFIQNARSAFATAPFSITAPYTSVDLTNCGSSSLDYTLNRQTCIDTSSDLQTWFTNPNGTYADTLSNFSKYFQSITTQSIPFYTPPIRLWGFDVGLLVQQPDLFAQRFSQALPNYNEFFRESSKDDPWIKTMLCALQPAPDDLDPSSASKLNLSADLINVGYEKRLGTKPSNYTRYALGSQDRPSDCATLTTYNPTS